MPPAVNSAHVRTTAPRNGRAFVARFIGSDVSRKSLRRLLVFFLFKAHSVAGLQSLAFFDHDLYVFEVATPFLVRVFEAQYFHLLQHAIAYADDGPQSPGIAGL